MINNKFFILPELIKYGFEYEYNYIVLNCQKISLEQLFISHKKSFSIKRACEITLNIIECIEVLHNNNIIHRDLKPQVLANEIKGEKTEIITLLDFGLWKNYKNKNDHIPFKQYKNMIGNNYIFGSINNLNRMELSRRDDLESIGYILIYFINGSVPWENILIKNKEEKIKKIIDMKKRMINEMMKEQLPEELKLFFSYIQNLGFEKDPDYYYLKNLLRIVINSEYSDKNFYFKVANKIIKY